ncbi:hypothetical protein [Kineosporia babensis]|uniref:Uncharacterized protein n=1 Tax=Kineosporia babensis TaxID=499548 RepID=A0A9X1T4K4_9ACTN|nr:hypothetical protein [Kineosporia babensis]MCD5316723.1 hypothetical protein [Kineosporia babensis]
MIPPVPPRPREEVPSPYGPDGPFRNLHRCAQRLETGDWREVLALLGGDGTSTHKLAAVTRLLALSMFQQTVGDVEQAWSVLHDAARGLPPGFTKVDPDTGHVAAVLQGAALMLAHEQAEPGGAQGPERRLTLALAGITWREQTELEQLRNRPYLYAGARDALVRACQEFLAWVEFAPETWRRQIPPGQLQSFGIVLPRTLHQPTRKNLCERASRLRKFADPAQGDVSDSVWADIGGYPGLKALALESLSTQHLTAWRLGPRSPVPKHLPVRTGCRAAWQFAQDCCPQPSLN